MNEQVPRRVLLQADLALGAALTVATMLAVLADITLILRLPLVVLLALFLPGYAIQSALILRPRLTALERLLISLAASIGATVIAGLIMAALGIELRAASWVGALSVIALVGFAVTWLRRVLKGIEGPLLTTPGVPWRQALILGLAVIIVADVLLVTRMVASSENADPPTQLWMVPGTNPLEAEVGVRAAPEGGHYDLVVSIAGRAVYDKELTLSPAEVWQVVLVLGEEDRQRPVVARLYESGSDVEMRYVVLQPSQVDASPAPDGG